MEKISASDVIFDFDEKNSRICSYYGWEFNDSHAFYNYLIGYKKAADATYDAFEVAVKNRDIETTDTVCYPLVFLYRHIVELLLKYSYVQLKDIRTAEEIKSFLNKGHDLGRLWCEIKPDFERLSVRLGIDVDINAIEHYIGEFKNYDAQSMTYRYPIDKRLGRFHSKGKFLNTPQLHESMNKYIDYVIHKVNELSNNLEDDEYNAEFESAFCIAINNSLGKIKEALHRIDSNIQHHVYSDISSNEAGLDNLDNLYNNGRDEIHKWIASFSEQEKSVLLLLYYTGSQIPQNNLAVDLKERREDVMKLVYGNAQNVSIDAPNSYWKDEEFEIYIAYGEKISLENIKRTLRELNVEL